MVTLSAVSLFASLQIKKGSKYQIPLRAQAQKNGGGGGGQGGGASFFFPFFCYFFWASKRSKKEKALCKSVAERYAELGRSIVFLPFSC
jgi:hypothetical protein